MSVFDKAKQQAQQWVGKAKETAGQAADKDEMKDAGKRDQFEGKAKETGQAIKDRAEGKAEDVQNRFRDQ